jgi:hypothetical protein
MLTIEYAKNPIWNDDTGNAILVTVKFAEFNEEMPFTATNYDDMPYGVDLYNRAKSGEFGEVLPYSPSGHAAEDQPTTTGTQII